MKIARALVLPVALIAATAAASSCSSSSSDTPAADTPLNSSRSYKGHQNDQDSNNFVNVHRATVGTRLDDCQTCHKGAELTYADSGKTTQKNACDYCHLVIHPSTDFSEAMPGSFADTLNPYGTDYATNGRSEDALRSIAGLDSDGDTFSNQDEITAFKYPGDPASKPGQPNAPVKLFTMEQVKAMPAYTEFLLGNTTKQQFDTYASYTGVKIRDLIAAAGVDPADPAIEGITVIAPDGFLKSIPAEKLNTPYPPGQFFGGLDTATLGTECGFVQYPDKLPDGVTGGAPIPGDPWLMLAYAREGIAMDPSELDVVDGKINGEGPFRLIVPQSTPGAPDRGVPYSPSTCGDSNDYDDNKDHNAGDMVRGVIAVRIDPLPAGVEDFDYRNGGWAYIASESVIVYGYGIQ